MAHRLVDLRIPTTPRGSILTRTCPASRGPGPICSGDIHDRPTDPSRTAGSVDRRARPRELGSRPSCGRQTTERRSRTRALSDWSAKSSPRTISPTRTATPAELPLPEHPSALAGLGRARRQRRTHALEAAPGRPRNGLGLARRLAHLLPDVVVHDHRRDQKSRTRRNGRAAPASRASIRPRHARPSPPQHPTHALEAEAAWPPDGVRPRSRHAERPL